MMENIFPAETPSTSAVAKVESPVEFFANPLKEEIVLYDECGDTQWDNVLAQYDLADQISEDINDITR
jgi:hypothetical protein